MEPVSTAIIAGAIAGVATGAKKVGEQAAVAAYNAAGDIYKALTTAIRKKYGSNSEVVKAIERLEKKPDSEGQKAVVVEEIKAAKVYEDAELITAAETLLTELKKIQTGKQAVTNITNAGVVGKNAHVEGGIHFGGN
ncbi:MAG: hypothetical protein D3906_00660 [Candidatus Electrothrix sp. AUS1_2]|nr:hypothetical protein [Candidatus Electrothrix sp. AUS1_2]